MKKKNDNDLGAVSATEVDAVPCSVPASRLSHAEREIPNAMEVSRYELLPRNPAVRFLDHCVDVFRRNCPQPPFGDEGNLIVMWRRDALALLKAVDVVKHVRKIAKQEADIFRDAENMSYGSGCHSAYCNILAQISAAQKDQIGSGTDSAQRSELVNGQERSAQENSQPINDVADRAGTPPRLQWHPIEMAPLVKVTENPVYVLLYGADIGICTGRAARHADGFIYVGVSHISGNIVGIATHWMPLPAPPVTAEEEKT